MPLLRPILKKISQWITYEPEYLGIPLCDYERIRFEIRPCDVLLIEGRSHVSDVIRHVTQSAWSHAALYIGRLYDIDAPALRDTLLKHGVTDPSEQLLIEGIMGRGIIVSPLSAYAKAHIRICRPRGLIRDDAQKVTSFAVRQLGLGYDTRQIFDMMRFFVPWLMMPRKWRSSIFSHRPGTYTKTVCSTMIAEAFGSVLFPILPMVQENDRTGIELVHRNPRLFTPRDFDYSPYFEIIKYPFIQTVEHGLYQKLPWNQEGLMSNDHEMVHLDHLPAKKKIPRREHHGPGLSDEEIATIVSQGRSDIGIGMVDKHKTTLNREAHDK